MRTRSSLLAIAAICLFPGTNAWAANLASFSFNSDSLANDATPITGISVTNVSTDSAFNAFTSASGWSNAAQISGASAFFSGPTTQAAAGRALFFTITADSGYTFSLDSFGFQARSTAQAPGDIGFTIGAVPYDFSLSYSNNSTITNISNPALGLTGLTSAAISIQGWNSTGASALQLDNLLATGAVTGPAAIPEPKAAVLGSIGILLLLRRRYR